MAFNDLSKRAATGLTIAQLKFKQALKKEDSENRLPSVAVELSAPFLSDIDAVLKKDTPTNVQKCTGWIVKHITPSKTRIASLGDYFVSVSKSIVLEHSVTAPAPAAEVKAALRSRFAVLLIVNDVLHTDKFHHRRGPAPKSSNLSKELTSHILELVELAASYLSEKDTKTETKLRALLNFWAINHLIGAEDFKAFRDRVDETVVTAQGGTPVRRRHYLLPEYHGDRNAEWNDLPASYMLAPMVKHPDRPLDIRHVKPVRFNKKPASPHVRDLLDNFFENIDLKYKPTGDNPTGETKKHKLWLDPMGQLVKNSKDTGNTTIVFNGYGWSKKFCQDMQKDGLPEAIRKAREEARREEEMETTKAPPQQRTIRRGSASSRRWDSESSNTDYDREGGRRSRSNNRRSSMSSNEYRSSGTRVGKSSRSYRSRHDRSRSRSSSRASYDSYDDSSRSGSRTHRHKSPRSSKRPGHHTHRYDDKRMEVRQPRAHGMDSSGAGNQWKAQGAPGHGEYPTQPQNYPQGFPPPPPFIPPQFPGQFPMQSFPPPPPPPFQPGAFPGGVPPPPPPLPEFTGPYPPAPMNMAATPNNPYNFNGNQFAGNTHGNNYGHGQNTGYGHNQGNFRGGRGGGYRGNYRGGGNGNRGGYGGQRGGR